MKDFIEMGREQYQTQSFDQHLSQLYKDGKITMQTALEAASNPADFQRALTYE